MSAAHEHGREFPEAPRADHRPTGADTGTGTVATLKRTFKEFSEDGMTDWAASLTYYGVLSIFPALIALVSIVGLFADPQTTTQKLTQIVQSISPGTSGQTFAGPIESITSNKGASGILFVVGLVGAIWSASGYVGAFSRAANVVWETPEGRPFYKLKPVQLLTTVLMLLLATLVLLSLIATGPVVDAIAGPLGISGTATTVWSIAKWPVLVVIVLLIFAVLYHFSPNVKMPSFKWVSAGALVALVLWVVASALFAFYVANFGSYDKTYGTLGGVVVALVWFWITNCVLLLGMEFNAERERSHELDSGVPRAEKEIQLEPRDTPKRQQTT